MYQQILLTSALQQERDLQPLINLLRNKHYTIDFIDNQSDLNNLNTNICLFIGINIDDCTLAKHLNLDFALATWACHDFKHIYAKYYFRQPYDILNILTMIENPYLNHKWLTTAMEMQFIAQAGLAYTKDDFDHERFARLSEMAAEIMSEYVDLPIEKVKTLFCNETGYQTPKLDTRSVIFKNDKILLVKERDGRWSLPGGWVDVNQSISDNLIKEAKEEAGLDVIPTRLIAIHDRNRHNVPLYAYGITKIFMLCEVISGKFNQNIETSDSAYFSLNNLPPLSLGKNTAEQIELCFAAYKNEDWIPIID